MSQGSGYPQWQQPGQQQNPQQPYGQQPGEPPHYLNQQPPQQPSYGNPHATNGVPYSKYPQGPYYQQVPPHSISFSPVGVYILTFLLAVLSIFEYYFTTERKMNASNAEAYLMTLSFLPGMASTLMLVIGIVMFVAAGRIARAGGKRGWAVFAGIASLVYSIGLALYSGYYLFIATTYSGSLSAAETISAYEIARDSLEMSFYVQIIAGVLFIVAGAIQLIKQFSGVFLILAGFGVGFVGYFFSSVTSLERREPFTELESHFLSNANLYRLISLLLVALALFIAAYSVKRLISRNLNAAGPNLTMNSNVTYGSPGQPLYPQSGSGTVPPPLH